MPKSNLNSSESKVIVALDYDNKDDALKFVNQVNPEICKLKVGKEMFTHFGPEFVKLLVQNGFDVFLDLKFHDIPNTVAKACAAAADLGVWMINVHAQGGLRMMQAAREALAEKNNPPKLIAVTVLTSMDENDLTRLGINQKPGELAVSLAKLANEAGLDGIVCSAQEAATMRKEIGDDFLLVTPGIRPAGSAIDDQRRIMTPVDAVNAGASYLVIGRPITKADDPVEVLKQINDELVGV